MNEWAPKYPPNSEILQFWYYLSFIAVTYWVEEWPLRNYVHSLESVNVTLFDKRVFTEVTDLRTSGWDHYGLSRWALHLMASVLIGDSQRRDRDRGGEVMSLWRDWKGSASTQGKGAMVAASGKWKRQGVSPTAFRGSAAPRLILHFCPQNYERINFCYFKPLSLRWLRKWTHIESFSWLYSNISFGTMLYSKPVVLNSGRTSTRLREPTTNPGLATLSEILPLWAWVSAGRSTEMRTAI